MTKTARAPVTAGPSIGLLLACARSEMDEASAAETERLLPLVEDWDSLIRLAALHGLLPLLAGRLTSGRFSPGVPGETLQFLGESFRTNARRNLFLLREVSRIVLLLEEHGIPSVPFKGPIMAEELYGDVALRQGGDLDLLIGREDFAGAGELLAADGYRPYPAATESILTTARHRRAYTEYYGTGTLTRDATGIYVDLHWEIGSCCFPPVLAALDYLKRCGTARVGDVNVPVPAPEDLVVLLAIHGSRHRWERLIWTCDIAEALRKYPAADWDRALASSGRLGVRRSVLIGMKLAADLFGAHLPPRAGEAMEGDRRARELAEEVRRDLVRADRSGASTPASRKALYHIRSLDHRLDRARYGLVRALWPNLNDWARFRLPDGLFPLYHLLRPFRLAAEYGSRMPGRRRGLTRR